MFDLAALHDVILRLYCWSHVISQMINLSMGLVSSNVKKSLESFVEAEVLNT